MFNTEEMPQLTGIIENMHVNEALRVILEVEEKEHVDSLFGWIARAWRRAFPSLDVDSFGAQTKWNTADEAIHLLRKMGVLYMLHHCSSIKVL